MDDPTNSVSVPEQTRKTPMTTVILIVFATVIATSAITFILANTALAKIKADAEKERDNLRTEQTVLGAYRDTLPTKATTTP